MSTEKLHPNFGTPLHPLTVALDGELVIIRVGTRTLATALEAGPILENGGGKITDPAKFAAAIVEELQGEAEDGTTLVHEMFDAAAVRAIENGCDGVSFPGDNGEEE